MFNEKVSIMLKKKKHVLTSYLWGRTKIFGDVTAFKIPTGFKTDLASIPRIFWAFISPLDYVIQVPAVIHDFLYKTHKPWVYTLENKKLRFRRKIQFTRKQADMVLREKMKSFGAGIIKRNLVYLMVRIGGWKAWNKHK